LNPDQLYPKSSDNKTHRGGGGAFWVRLLGAALFTLQSNNFGEKSTGNF
jgi:hypothetical protein